MRYVIQTRGANGRWETPKFRPQYFDTKEEAEAFIKARLAEDDRYDDVYGPGAARIKEVK
jgi:hypothetical protein